MDDDEVLFLFDCVVVLICEVERIGIEGEGEGEGMLVVV